MSSVGNIELGFISGGEQHIDDVNSDPCIVAERRDDIEERAIVDEDEDEDETRPLPQADEMEDQEKVEVEQKRSVLNASLEFFKYLYSVCLLVWCVVIIMSAIFSEKTSLARGVHPWFAFFIFWFLIFWLAMMEGGQGCLVGLQPVEPEKYADSHPCTLKNTQIAHNGDNMERFIVGRQFLVVLVFFLINMSASPSLEDGDSILGLGKVTSLIFLDNGVAMMITTVVIGQLTSQVNAAVCMLDFINNYFMLFTTYISLIIEFSGLLHAVYLVQLGFSVITGKPVETNEKPRNTAQMLFFWVRILISTAILCFALAVNLEALFKGQSGMWKGVPPWLSVIIFFLLLGIVGLMDGMQIAAFALVNMSEEELETHKVAFTNCQLMFSGQNLQAFLIGRQLFVACLMFIVARIATISIPDGQDNLFGLPDDFQNFLDTGLLGSVVLTIIGSLAWRIVASSFPVAFMSNPAIYVIIRICLMVESTGICSSSWLLAGFHKPLAGYQNDEVYLQEEEDDGVESMICHEKNT